jgi:putative glycosyltransferase (TIGR04348 family)
MRILIVTPTRGEVQTGNRCTAADWERILGGLGHEATVAQAYAGEDADVLIALHACHSRPSIEAFRTEHPARPVVVALTGTDVYPDLGPEARESLGVATRIVVLQPAVRRLVPPELRERVRIVIQSATASTSPRRIVAEGSLQVVVAAHMRHVKDPLRAAEAVRQLPSDSRVRVVHAGAVLDREYGDRAAAEDRDNPRWRWIGELSPKDTRALIAGSDLLVLSSREEGGGRVIGEAAAAGTPIVAARNDATTSLLGDDYPGLFEPGDTAGLAKLLRRTETESAFLDRLRDGTARLAGIVDPAREASCWEKLLAELRSAPETERARTT